MKQALPVDEYHASVDVHCVPVRSRNSMGCGARRRRFGAEETRADAGHEGQSRGIDRAFTGLPARGDPATLEVVFLDDKKEGPSRVSDDGEVIFFYKASDKKQQALIEQAFEIRARER